MAKRVVAFGELLLRLDTRGHDRFVQAEDFRARWTGAEANVAVSLAGFGHEAHVVSRVPAHEIGEACLNGIRRFGVRVDHVARGGDAFSAGIIHGLLSGWDAGRVVEFAAAAACLKHSIPGDFNLFSAEEVEALLAGADGSRVAR